MVIDFAELVSFSTIVRAEMNLSKVVIAAAVMTYRHRVLSHRFHKMKKEKIIYAHTNRHCVSLSS